MSAKKKYRNQKGKWNIGNWLKRYWAKNTCRMKKHKGLEKEEMKILISMEYDWADEMNVGGFRIYEEEEGKEIINKIEELKPGTKLELYIGTNQSEEMTKEELLNIMNSRLISEKEEEYIRKLFNLKGDTFGNFSEIDDFL